MLWKDKFFTSILKHILEVQILLVQYYLIIISFSDSK
jgi:hypothetical protein